MKQPQMSFVAGALDPALHERVDIPQYQTGLQECHNFLIKPQGGVYNRPGTRYINTVKTSAKKTRLIPFKYNATQQYVLEFGDLYIRVILNGAYVESSPGVPLEVVTTYTENELFGLQYSQVADVMTITHQSHAVAELSRISATSWTLANVDFGFNGALRPCGTARTAATAPTLTLKGALAAGTARNYKYVVTSIDLLGVESEESAAVDVDVDAVMNDTKGIQIEWSIPSTSTFSDIEYYNVYRETSEGNSVFGLVGTAKIDYGLGATTGKFIDYNVSPDTSITPPRDHRPFIDTSTFPAVCGFYQQRRLFANSVNLPQTFWTSQTGIYKSLRASTPLRDTDGITFTIASRQVDEIRHILDLEQLIIMTAGAIYPVSEGQDFVLTPSSISARARTYIGAATIRPEPVIDSIIYVTEKGNRLRDIMNNKDLPGDGGVDLTLLAYHLFEKLSIVEMTYAHEPYGILWCVMSDGGLNALTYDKQQQIWAWHHHSTDGVVESITSVTEGDRDAVYMVVKRTINGSEARYIERLEKREDLTVEDSFFVDCGYTYAGASTTSITGLGHLEGKTVVVLADGVVVKNLTVASGAITLPRAATKVQIGLPYTSRIRTLPINQADEDSYDAYKNVARVITSFYRSRGGFAGPDLNNLNEIRPRFVEDGYGVITPKTYELPIAIDPDWNKNGDVYFVQEDPLPLAILGITPDFDKSG